MCVPCGLHHRVRSLDFSRRCCARTLLRTVHWCSCAGASPAWASDCSLLQQRKCSRGRESGTLTLPGVNAVAPPIPAILTALQQLQQCKCDRALERRRWALPGVLATVQLQQRPGLPSADLPWCKCNTAPDSRKFTPLAQLLRGNCNSAQGPTPDLETILQFGRILEFGRTAMCLRNP